MVLVTEFKGTAGSLERWSAISNTIPYMVEQLHVPCLVQNTQQRDRTEIGCTEFQQ